jgi:GxxExxY protein
MTAKEYNKRYAFFQDITGKAMQVHSEYHGGLLESAYEAALTYLLVQDGYHVERQVFLPIYWKDIKLDQNYRMDLVVNHEVIIELKAMTFTGLEHRKQLWNYLNLTHMPYGMLINFSPKGLYSEWYHRHQNGEMEQIRIQKE